LISIYNPLVTTPVGCPPFNDYAVKHELYFDEGLTEQFDFSTDIFQTVQNVYIKTIMKTAGIRCRSYEKSNYLIVMKRGQLQRFALSFFI